MLSDSAEPSAFRWPERANEVTFLSDHLYPVEAQDKLLVTGARTAITEGRTVPGSVGKFLTAPTSEGMPDFDAADLDDYLRYTLAHAELRGSDSGSLDLRNVTDAHAVHKEALVERYAAWLAASHYEMGSRSVYRLKAQDLFFLSTTRESATGLSGQQLREKSAYLVGRSLLRDHDRIDKFLQRTDQIDRELGAEEGVRGVIVDFTELPDGARAPESVRDMAAFCGTERLA